MSLTYLTPSWAQALTTAAATDPSLPGLVGSVTARIAVDVSDAPAGPVRVIYAFANRAVTVTADDGSAPEAVLAVDYATAAAMGRSDLGPMAAYARGKVTLTGNPAKVLPVLRALERLNVLNASLGTAF